MIWRKVMTVSLLLDLDASAIAGSLQTGREVALAGGHARYRALLPDEPGSSRQVLGESLQE